MQTVTLTDHQCRLAIYFGRARNDWNQRRNYHDDKQNQYATSEQTHINGMGGELAACLLFNRCPDFSIGAKRDPGDFHTWGFIGGQFRRIATDVKTTDSKIESACLNVSTSKNNLEKRADVYLLVCGRLPTYTIVGYCSMRNVFDRRNLVDGFVRPYYRVEQHRLHKNLELFTKYA